MAQTNNKRFVVTITTRQLGEFDDSAEERFIEFARDEAEIVPHACTDESIISSTQFGLIASPHEVTIAARFMTPIGNYLWFWFNDTDGWGPLH